MKHFILFLFLLNLSSFSFLEDGLSHMCKPVAEVQCTNRALLCPPGYIDGCLTGESEIHQCQLKHDGPSCDIPMNLQCPKNFQDGCLVNQTVTHECVPKKGPSCEENVKFSCPMNFEDSCI